METNKYSKAKWICGNVPEIISSAAFAIILIVVFFNVMLRYFFSISFVWCEEVAAIGFIWVIFIGAAACYKRKMHIGIDVLVAAVPSNVQRYLQIFLHLFMVIINLWLIYLSLKFSISAWTKITLALRIPYTFLDIASTVGFMFMTYYACIDFIHSFGPLKKITRGEKE
jgi:TRAP-type C4-dicarboxylate transport system permease small subunit